MTTIIGIAMAFDGDARLAAAFLADSFSSAAVALFWISSAAVLRGLLSER